MPPSARSPPKTRAPSSGVSKPTGGAPSGASRRSATPGARRKTTRRSSPWRWPATRRAVAEALPKVCRTGTHLFHFAAYVDTMRGWGRGLRRAIADWYTNVDAEDVAFQAVKYQQRDGWSHRDMLRLAHPVAPTAEHNIVFNWIAKGWPGIGDEPHPTKAAQVIWAFERAKRAEKSELLKLITDYRLPREALPTQWLTDADVWAALLPNLGLTALIRNLGNLSRCRLLAAGNREVVSEVTLRITSKELLRKARVHPIAILAALMTYQAGKGVRGDGTWTVVSQVVDALDSAFYGAFGNVQPSGKRLVLALDVSGSMARGMIAGTPGLTPRVGSAAMALVTAATERTYNIIAFSRTMVHIDITPRQRLDDVVRAVSSLEFGGTDCALPMLWALESRVDADAFVILTDNETWAGAIHPAQALQNYRVQTGIPAKLIVVGMTSSGFSIADPDDAGMLDCVGFDTATPQVISDFAADR